MLYHSRVEEAAISLELYSTEDALVAIRVSTSSRKPLASWLSRFFDGASVEPAGRRHADYQRQLREYLVGRRRVFELPLDPRGSDFQREVWRAVESIPYGATATYSEIANRIGKPSAVRAVGAANGANPIPLVIPCHRVLGSDGSLTGYGGGLPLKEWLLALEGIRETPAVQKRLF